MDKRFPLADQIAMLASSLRGQVIAAEHVDYDATRMVAMANYDYRPAAVIRVANAADVAATLNFAQATGLDLAIRSGGHSVGGHSGTQGGLVLDLRGLAGIEIDTEARTVWAGAGLNAGEVTAAVEQHGLIVGFGDSATVGIGGLTVGGGIGYLVRKHGLTIDSLLAAEVVTAGGDIVIADETSHPDLFWAIRGGGGNFGVVTRFKYRLHPLPHFVGGPLILPARADVLTGFIAAAEQAPEELSTIAMVMSAPPLPFIPAELHGKLVLMGMMAYAGAPERANQVLAPFRALATPIADLVGPAPYSSMYIPEDPTMRPSVTVRSSFMERIGMYDAQRILETLDRSDAPMKMAQIRVLGGAMARVAPEATAFAHRKSRIMTAFLAMYAPFDDQAKHDRWAADGIAALRQGDAGCYVNFLGLESPERIRAAYPGGTWERLRQVKAKYDPENLFRLNQNIPPA